MADKILSDVITTPFSTNRPSESQGGSPAGEAAAAILLSAWVILANLTLIFIVLGNEKRRNMSFNLHIVNLAVSSLITGGLVLPLYAHILLKGYWDLSDDVCRVWLGATMAVCTLPVVVVCALLFDRFVLFTCPSIADGCCKYVFSAVMILVPWCLTAAFVIPVYLDGETGHGVDSANGICFLDLSSVYAVTAILGGYAVPAIASFGLLVATSLTWCVKRDEIRAIDWSKECENIGWQLITSWIVCTAVIGLWMPWSAFNLLIYALPTTWPAHWMTLAKWAGYATAGITPLLWLAMPRIRLALCKLCCCCCCCCRCGRERKRRYNKRDRLEIDNDTAMIEVRDSRE